MFVGFVIGFVCGFFVLAGVVLYFIHLDEKSEQRLQNMIQYAEIDTEDTLRLYPQQ